MANFGQFKITNVGLELEYKAQAGKELKFSKFIVGDGYYSGSIANLTELVNPLLEFDVKRLNIQTLSDNKKISIGFNIDGMKIEKGFYLREIGLYAKDPDTQEDILVFYGNAGNTADYIAPKTSTTISEKLIDLEVYISNVDNITAIIDSSLVYASKQDLDALQSKVNETVSEVLDAIDKQKQNLLVKSFAIETTDWTQENELYTATIEDESIKETDMADISIDNETYSIAEDAGVKAYTVEVEGGIKLFAESVPTDTITGKYVVNRGEVNG